jgi:DNA-binding NarL/FixJ family response regulator
MQSNRPRIIIADDHAFVADGCKKLLEPEFDVVATVGDGRALVRIAATLKPQVIVVDIGMPLLNGLDAGQQIKQILRSVKLVFLTMNTDSALAAEAFRCGGLRVSAENIVRFGINNCRAGGLEGLSYLSSAVTKETVDLLLHQDKAIDEKATAYRTAARSFAVADRRKVDERGGVRVERDPGYGCRS